MLEAFNCNIVIIISMKKMEYTDGEYESVWGCECEVWIGCIRGDRTKR